MWKLAGKGKAVTIIPNIFIDSEKSLLIDDIQFTFVPEPNTETRAHMTVYDNTHKVLALGDISMGTLHNTYIPRGARARDAAYKFPNDEALLLANKGVKLQDIGRKINIPDRISKTWYTRDHYGNYTFNARGAVNRILGFYNGNPVNLWPLEETEYAARFVEYAGGEDEALKKARYLGADALEQLAYQTQTGLWRNMYLTGAYELRNPDGKKNAPHLMDNSEVMPYVNAGLLFDYLGINFDGEKGIDLQEKFIIEITDTDDAEKYVVTLYKGTLLYDRLSGQKNTGQLTCVKLSRTQLYQLSSAKLGAEAFDGQTDDGRRIISLIQDNITDTAVYSDFNIIEPLAQ